MTFGGKGFFIKLFLNKVKRVISKYIFVSDQSEEKFNPIWTLFFDQNWTRRSWWRLDVVATTTSMTTMMSWTSRTRVSSMNNCRLNIITRSRTWRRSTTLQHLNDDVDSVAILLQSFSSKMRLFQIWNLSSKVNFFRWKKLRWKKHSFQTLKCRYGVGVTPLKERKTSSDRDKVEKKKCIETNWWRNR